MKNKTYKIFEKIDLVDSLFFLLLSLRETEGLGSDDGSVTLDEAKKWIVEDLDVAVANYYNIFC